MANLQQGEYQPPGRFWPMVAGLLAVGGGLSGYEGWRLLQGWNSGTVAPFCKHCAGFPAVTRAASPSLFWATMAGHAVLALLGLAVLVMGARMLMARFAGVDVPPDPASERDRQRRLDRMREEK